MISFSLLMPYQTSHSINPGQPYFGLDSSVLESKHGNVGNVQSDVSIAKQTAIAFVTPLANGIPLRLVQTGSGDG